MEIKILNLPNNKGINIGGTLISKISDNNKSSVLVFITNYCKEYIIDYEKTDLYICYTGTNSNMQIFGIFGFRENMPPFNDTANVNCHELYYLFIDSNILNFDVLTNIFSIVFPQIVNRFDNNDEGFWFSHNGEIYGKRIDKLFKTCNVYYFQNESEYFANKIIKIIQEIEQRNMRLNFLKPNGE